MSFGNTAALVASEMIDSAAPVSTSMSNSFPFTSSWTMIGSGEFPCNLCRLNSLLLLVPNCVSSCTRLVDLYFRFLFAAMGAFEWQTDAMCSVVLHVQHLASLNLQSFRVWFDRPHL